VHVYTRGAYVSLSIVEAGLIRSLPMMDENPQDASSPPDQEATPSSEPQSPPTEDKPTSTQQPPAGAAASRGPPAPETPQEKKAKEFLAQAEKKIKSSQSFFGGLFGGAAKMEDAADLYVRAANTFKVAKKWREAGDAFCLAADVHMKLDVKHEAGSVLVEAGQVLKREDPKRAVDCYLQAAEIYTDMGRFSMAARYHNTIAEIYEGELVDFEQAITHYEQAADYYRGEDSTGSANRCLLKVAHMSAQMQQFDKAAGIFEEVGRNSLENNLLRYSAKDYFFKAAICRYCIGVEDVKDAVEGYKQIHPGFEGTRELKLIEVHVAQPL
jgi:alpha-soluble NSF attachment protein